MTRSHHVARIAFAGALAGSCAVGLACQASGSPCDPDTMRMTPQPVLSCPDPDASPPPPQLRGAPVAGGSFTPTASGVMGSAPADPGAPAFPAPGQAPNVPPVVNADGSQTFGQGGGYLGDIWDQFHNGVPSDLIYGPVSGDPAAPPPP